MPPELEANYDIVYFQMLHIGRTHKWFLLVYGKNARLGFFQHFSAHTWRREEFFKSFFGPSDVLQKVESKENFNKSGWGLNYILRVAGRRIDSRFYFSHRMRSINRRKTYTKQSFVIGKGIETTYPRRFNEILMWNKNFITSCHFAKVK